MPSNRRTWIAKPTLPGCRFHDHCILQLPTPDDLDVAGDGSLKKPRDTLHALAINRISEIAEAIPRNRQRRGQIRQCIERAKLIKIAVEIDKFGGLESLERLIGSLGDTCDRSDFGTADVHSGAVWPYILALNGDLHGTLEPKREWHARKIDSRSVTGGGTKVFQALGAIKIFDPDAHERNGGTQLSIMDLDGVR